MNRWRAVVFDLDDTLYPERDYVRGGFEATAAWAEAFLGAERQQVFSELWAMFEAGVRGDTFDRWLARRGKAAGDNRLAMVAAYRGHEPRLTPYPDVLPALSALRGKAQLGLITEGARPAQEKKLAALGLRHAFDKVIMLGEGERADWKPSPRPFERWLMGTEISPHEAVYLGDNPAKDFLGARRAGWSSVRVRRADGLHRDEERLAWAADFMPDSKPVSVSSASFQSIAQPQSELQSLNRIANRESSIANLPSKADPSLRSG
jgi:putative hydrolase of the HAD superfamily